MGGKTFPSEWTKRSTWELVHEDVGLVVSDPEQVILEADRPHHLSSTWHFLFTRVGGARRPRRGDGNGVGAERRSKVAYDLEERSAGLVRLTVTHHGFVPGSRVLPALSQG